MDVQVITERSAEALTKINLKEIVYLGGNRNILHASSVTMIL